MLPRVEPEYLEVLHHGLDVTEGTTVINQADPAQVILLNEAGEVILRGGGQSKIGPVFSPMSSPICLPRTAAARPGEYRTSTAAILIMSNPLSLR